MKEMKRYVVVLPYNIDESMFERLSVNPTSKTRNNLIRAYEKIDVMNITSATSPKGALSNVVFRELGGSVNSSSIVKMLSPDLEMQVFEFPLPEDNNELALDQAIILRDWELASDIASKRAGTARIHYRNLRKLKKRHYQKKNQ